MARETLLSLPHAWGRRVDFELEIPEGVDPEKIGANMQYVADFCNAAGINYLKVVNSDINAPNRLSTYTMNPAPDRPGFAPLLNTGWADVEIAVNMEEVQKRALSSGSDDLTKFSKFLDKAVREPLVNAGTRHVLSGERTHFANTAIANLLVIYALGAKAYYEDWLGVGAAVGVGILINAAANFIDRGRGMVHLDRAIMLKIMGARKKVIEAIEG